MRAKVARRLRRICFGTDFSPRVRQYFHHPRFPGTIIANPRRISYQQLKRAYLRGEFTL